MNVRKTAIPDVLLLEPKVFGDTRGFFMETWNQAVFDGAVGRRVEFVQDNHSLSAKGVLRGIHLQSPRPQGKLVRVVRGEVFDVAVDLRRGSPTYGKWVGEVLSAENKRQLWVPEGFGHGFFTLSEQAEFLYKVTDYYLPQNEHCIRWDDPDLAIEWPTGGTAPLVSQKDAKGGAFRDAVAFEPTER